MNTELVININPQKIKNLTMLVPPVECSSRLSKIVNDIDEAVNQRWYLNVKGEPYISMGYKEVETLKLQLHSVIASFNATYGHISRNFPSRKLTVLDEYAIELYTLAKYWNNIADIRVPTTLIKG